MPLALSRLVSLLTTLQAILSIRVLLRLVRTSRGAQRIAVPEATDAEAGSVTVIVPVLNEHARLRPCLDGLIGQGSGVGEILVIDGGSTDGTQDLVRLYRNRDRRIRLIDASPIPAGWNGKAWGLQAGFQHSDPDARWILCLDADVRPHALLAGALVAHAQRLGLDALSAATAQIVEGVGEALVHPALLTTLVYRFGSPGHEFRRVGEVQANGQCFLIRRDVLARGDGFTVARMSRCEDVTLARALVAAGHRVGFYETDDLISVRMYAGWRETWRNWPRSLPMRDQFSGAASTVGLGEVALVQALPLPLLAALVVGRRRWGARAQILLALNGALVALRLGVLAGTARAYRRIRWSYWLSPLCDLPAACSLGISVTRRRHLWRGRLLVEGGTR